MREPAAKVKVWGIKLENMGNIEFTEIGEAGKGNNEGTYWFQ